MSDKASPLAREKSEASTERLSAAQALVDQQLDCASASDSEAGERSARENLKQTSITSKPCSSGDSVDHKAPEIVMENKASATSGNHSAKPASNDVRPLSPIDTSINGDSPNDQKSPRKKRSRDNLDEEISREQKIVATEQARAKRQSVEIDRAELSLILPESVPKSENSVEKPKSPIKSTFGQPNSITARSRESVIESGAVPPKETSTSNDSKAVTPSAFASSGFAALAKSTASPFATLAGSTFATTSTDSPTLQPKNDSVLDIGTSNSSKSNTAPAAVFGGAANFNSKGTFGSSLQTTGNRLATFAAPQGNANISSTTVLNSSTFPNKTEPMASFATFPTSSKLTSFAAPNGATAFGATIGSGAIKPFGQADSNSDSGSNDYDEEEGVGGDTNNAGSPGRDASEPSSREKFHVRDVDTGEDGETTVFSTRASLFVFRNAKWNECGHGTFKFNISDTAPLQPSSPSSPHTPSSTDPSSSSPAPEARQSPRPIQSARFIMRAQQTYRLILNASVVKQMEVGGIRGAEPTGRSFAFAVSESDAATGTARLMPFMIKLADAAESKDLWHLVRRIQERLA